MRINYQEFRTLKASKLSEQPVVAALSLKAWKDGKWLGRLPAAVRKRVDKAAARLKSPLAEGGRLFVPGGERGEEDMWIMILPKEAGTFFLLEAARDVLKDAIHVSTKQLMLLFPESEYAEALCDTFGSATAARIFAMPTYGKRAKDEKKHQLKTVTILAEGDEAKAAFERGFIAGDGTNLARYLATLPPNVLNTKSYGERIRKLCRENGIAVKFYSKSQLKRMGAGAFTAVDQGNPESNGGIYELTYTPRSARNTKPVILVGKGLCFDTGGYDVKTGGYMHTMKGDMQGSAVALASLLSAAKAKVPLRMKAFLGVTENHISPRAYKSDEVVTAMNGLSIEVVNTDAEGRMVLADTLVLATRQGATCVIDYATLTGSAVRAIGTKFSAAFSNRKELHSAILSAGEHSGERVWTFPIDSTYFKALDSKVADILQCTKGPGPDHIHAACFLSKFVKEGVPWVHIDLSASENDAGLGHVDSMFTGFGVRWTMEFLKNYI